MATGPSPYELQQRAQAKARAEADARTKQQQAEVTAARNQMRQAEHTLDQLNVVALREFNTSDDYKSATTELAKAQAAYDAAKAAAVSSLANSPDYVKALAEQSRTQDLVKAAKADDGCCGADVAADALRAAGVVHKMEAAALTGSDEVKAAWARLQTAQAKVSTLRSEFFKSLPDSGPTGDAKTALAAARERVNAAEAALAGRQAPTKMASATPKTTLRTAAQ